MKVIYLFILFICLLQIQKGFTQNVNPFEPIGKKGKITTAYGKRFEETFDNDSIQRIGSVLVNIHKRRIVKILDSREIFNKFSDNSSSSRWMSIDPHAETYANMSPYSAMGNNPILYTDPDGQDLVITGSKEMQDRYARLLSQTTGYNIAINNETGLVSMGEAIEGARNTSSVLASLISGVTKSENVYSFGLTGDKGDDKNVWIDSYEQGLVDVADLNKIDKKGGNELLAGVMGHFIAEVSATENYADQGSRKAKFKDAHDVGLAKEGEIVGNMTGQGTIERTTSPISADDQEKLYRYTYGNRSYILGAGVVYNHTTEEIKYIGGVPVKFNTTTTKTNGKLTKVKAE